MGRGKWSGTVGVLLLLAALVLTVHNLREARQAEHFSGETAAKLTEEISRRRTAREAEPEPQSEAPPEAEAESTDYLGLLELPTLSLTLPVAAEWSYPALKRTPCRYSGTAGEVSFVIIAHNYPAHFGRLWELEPGAEVYFTDMDGMRWTYEVSYVENLQPTQIEEMTEKTEESDEWDLTLFTCTTGGSARCAVRCVRTGYPALTTETAE